MSYVNSPKVQYTPDGRPPERKNWRRLVLRGGIVIIFVVALAVNLYAFQAGNLLNRLSGTDGVVQGVVVNAQGQPLAGATVSLASAPESQASSLPDGRFQLSNVPTGSQYLIVASEGVGQGYVITVQNDSATQVGPIVYEAMPEVWR